LAVLFLYKNSGAFLLHIQYHSVETPSTSELPKTAAHSFKSPAKTPRSANGIVLTARIHARLSHNDLWNDCGMAREIGKPSPAKVKNETNPGLYGDGAGRYLNVATYSTAVPGRWALPAPHDPAGRSAGPGGSGT
jgi:hypothetical protein